MRLLSPLKNSRLLGLIRLATTLTVGVRVPAVAYSGEGEQNPALYTRLALKQIIRVPFRLNFQGYDGDPKKDRIEKFSFQIATLDLRQPSEFLKIGETISHTNLRLVGFEYKILPSRPAAVEEGDVSELTIVDTETKVKTVLILNRITNFPDFYAVFVCKGSESSAEFRVKKLDSFSLTPGEKKSYQLLDVKEDTVVVKLPEGQTAPDGGNTVEIPRDPAFK